MNEISTINDALIKKMELDGIFKGNNKLMAWLLGIDPDSRNINKSARQRQ